jgi:hypothetical protein
MSYYSDQTCNVCGSSKYVVHFTEKFGAFLRTFSGFDEFTDASYVGTHTVVEKVLSEVVYRSKESDIAIDYVALHSEEYLEAKLKCLNCQTQRSSSIQRDFSNQIYSGLSNKLHELELAYCSEAVGADLSNIRSMLWGSNWSGKAEELLRESPEKLNHLKRLRSFRDLFIPAGAGKGGDGAFSLFLLLSTIGVNLASNFLYDLMKGARNKLKSKTVRLKERRVVRSARKELEGKGMVDKIVPPRRPEKYSSDILSIIASMPKKQKDRIVNEIATQHTKNIKQQLLDSIEKKKAQDA